MGCGRVCGPRPGRLFLAWRTGRRAALAHPAEFEARVGGISGNLTWVLVLVLLVTYSTYIHTCPLSGSGRQWETSVLQPQGYFWHCGIVQCALLWDWRIIKYLLTVCT